MECCPLQHEAARISMLAAAKVFTCCACEDVQDHLAHLLDICLGQILQQVRSVPQGEGLRSCELMTAALSADPSRLCSLFYILKAPAVECADHGSQYHPVWLLCAYVDFSDRTSNLQGLSRHGRCTACRCCQWPTGHFIAQWQDAVVVNTTSCKKL